MPTEGTLRPGAAESGSQLSGIRARVPSVPVRPLGRYGAALTNDIDPRAVAVFDDGDNARVGIHPAACGSSGPIRGEVSQASDVGQWDVRGLETRPKIRAARIDRHARFGDHDVDRFPRG